MRRCGLMATVALLLCAQVALAADAWRAALWPEHVAHVERYADLVATVNADSGIPASDAEKKAVVEELVGATHEPLSRKDLLGAFQLRSIQGTRYGIFTYPYFKARIVEKDGVLFFEKQTGSQRRSGRLVPRDADGRDFVFVGASTVNDDPQQRYSRDAGARGPADGDSVGVLYRIDDGRLVMVLDAGPDAYEVYQLRR